MGQDDEESVRWVRDFEKERDFSLRMESGGRVGDLFMVSVDGTRWLVASDWGRFVLTTECWRGSDNR